MKKDKKNKKHSDTTQQPFQRNVFLDTQVFKTNNCNFDSYPLRILKERFGPFSKEAKILFSVPGGALHKHSKKIDVLETTKV